jgi:hypothetical protein
MKLTKALLLDRLIKESREYTSFYSLKLYYFDYFARGQRRMLLEEG